MFGVFDLRNVLQFIVDGLDYGTLSKKLFKFLIEHFKTGSKISESLNEPVNMLLRLSIFDGFHSSVYHCCLQTPHLF